MNLGANFEIISTLGEGGCGVVHLARQRSLRRLVALKVLKPEYLSEGNVKKRFQREARILKGLSHPNVIKTLDVDLEGSDPYIAFEYVPEARSVADALTSKPVSQVEAKRIIRQIVGGLAHLHEKGVVHRDIKPGNILLLPDLTAKIIDLGLGRMVSSDATRLTQEGQVVGTLSYMAPEQILGSEANFPSDVYALGLVAIELLAGRLIFSATVMDGYSPVARLNPRPIPVSDLVVGLEPQWVAVLAACVSHEASDRPKSAGVLESLLRFDSSEARVDITEPMPAPVVGKIPGPTGSKKTRVQGPARQKRPPWIWGGVLAIFMGWLGLRGPSSHPPEPPRPTASQSPSPTIDPQVVWEQLERLNPESIGRQLYKYLDHPPDLKKAEEIWNKMVPGKFFSPSFAKMARETLLNETNERPLAQALERISALESLHTYMRREGITPKADPQDLLPDRYREEFHISSEVFKRNDPCLRGKIVKDVNAYGQVRLNGRLSNRTSSETWTRVRTFDDSGVAYETKFGVDAGYEKKDLLGVLGGNSQSREQGFGKSKWPTSWRLEVDLGASSPPKNKLAFLDVHTSDLGLNRFVVEVNGKLRFSLSKTHFRQEKIVGGQEGHGKRVRGFPTQFLTSGWNTFLIEVLPYPGCQPCEPLWLGSFTLRVPGAPARITGPTSQ